MAKPQPTRQVQFSAIRQERSIYQRYFVWDIELFFKWIKQNLRIKLFFGTSENAVKTQIWIAVCVYVLIAIIKKELALDVPLYTFLQILSVCPFEKVLISQPLFDREPAFSSEPPTNQLNLFDS